MKKKILVGLITAGALLTLAALNAKSKIAILQDSLKLTIVNDD